jgi:hypothetical protein
MGPRPRVTLMTQEDGRGNFAHTPTYRVDATLAIRICVDAVRITKRCRENRHRIMCTFPV